MSDGPDFDAIRTAAGDDPEAEQAFRFLVNKAVNAQLTTATLILAHRLGLVSLEDFEVQIIEAHGQDEVTQAQTMMRLFKKILGHMEQRFPRLSFPPSPEWN